jgi:seryl-tRNA synthetase
VCRDEKSFVETQVAGQLEKQESLLRVFEQQLPQLLRLELQHDRSKKLSDFVNLQSLRAEKEKIQTRHEQLQDKKDNYLNLVQGKLNYLLLEGEEKAAGLRQAAAQREQRIATKESLRKELSQALKRITHLTQQLMDTITDIIPRQPG